MRKGSPWPERSWIGTGCWNRPPGRRPPWSRALPTEQRRATPGGHGRAPLAAGRGVGTAGPSSTLSLRLNALAADCFPPDAVPRALWRQRAELARSAGRCRGCPTAPRTGREGPGARSPRPVPAPAHGIPATGAASPRLLPLLQEASRRQSDNFSVWMILGNCYCRAGKAQRGHGVLRHGRRPVAGGPLALTVPGHGLPGAGERSASPRRLRRGHPVAARAAERVFQPGPGEVPPGRPSRCAGRSDASPERPRAAAARLFPAGQGPGEGKGTARAPGAIGRTACEGNRATNSDWTARGLARLPRDPEAALADYEAALKLNPRYLSALQNKANVLAEDLGRTAGGHRGAGPGPGPHPNYVPARRRPGRACTPGSAIARPRTPTPGRPAEGFEAVHRLSGRRHLRADVPSGTRRSPGSLSPAGLGPRPGDSGWTCSTATPIWTPSGTSPNSAGWSSRRGPDATPRTPPAARPNDDRRRGGGSSPGKGSRSTPRPIAARRSAAGGNRRRFSWRSGGAESATPFGRSAPVAIEIGGGHPAKRRMLPPDSPGPTASPGSCESGRDLGIISGPRSGGPPRGTTRDEHAMAKHRPETGRNSLVFRGSREAEEGLSDRREVTTAGRGATGSPDRPGGRRAALAGSDPSDPELRPRRHIDRRRARATCSRPSTAEFPTTASWQSRHRPGLPDLGDADQPVDRPEGRQRRPLRSRRVDRRAIPDSAISGSARVRWRPT